MRCATVKVDEFPPLVSTLLGEKDNVDGFEVTVNYPHHTSNYVVL
jgi:hypothetical protein